MTLREMREVCGRESIRQVGLLCIFVGFPIAELAQSLVSTSVSFTDTFILAVVGFSSNLRPEEVRRVPRTSVLVVFVIPHLTDYFTNLDVTVVLMEWVKHGSLNMGCNSGALLVEFVEENLTKSRLVCWVFPRGKHTVHELFVRIIFFVVIFFVKRHSLAPDSFSVSHR